MLRTEKEVDEMIAKMVERSKGQYITQGTSFNKNCPRQMNLLKKALMSSASFSGLVKEMLALRFENHASNQPTNIITFQSKETDKPKAKNVGNFI